MFENYRVELTTSLPLMIVEPKYVYASSYFSAYEKAEKLFGDRITGVVTVHDFTKKVALKK